MESSFEIESAFRALEMQFLEGVDEWIMSTPRSRFDEALEKNSAPAEVATSVVKKSPKPVEKVAEKPVDIETLFENLRNDDEIFEALYSALPKGLQSQLQNPLADLGGLDAEIAVVTDPPFREALSKGSLLGDLGIALLLKSLQAISLDLDARSGKEPRAALRILSISPWRMPQDRKFVESEAEIFRNALKARLALGQHRALLLAGSNLAGLEKLIEESRLYDLPVFELVSPRVMLKEPQIKRVHWQRLLNFHGELDGILKI